MRILVLIVSLAAASLTLDARNHSGGTHGPRNGGMMRGGPGMAGGSSHRMERTPDRSTPRAGMRKQQQQRDSRQRQTEEESQRQRDRREGANRPRN